MEEEGRERQGQTKTARHLTNLPIRYVTRTASLTGLEVAEKSSNEECVNKIRVFDVGIVGTDPSSLGIQIMSRLSHLACSFFFQTT